jgi:uncharacterized protein YndB with AHSA1/START domain
MSTLPHRLNRTIVIGARPEVVFRYFSDSTRWASWWGKGSTIDCRPGGAVLIVFPNAIEVRGEVIEVAPPERLVLTYGFASGAPIPAGGSRVTIRLEPTSRGTRLSLEHEFAEVSVRDEHVQGWRYQLAVFANVVSNELHAEAPRVVDDWFQAWSEPDAERRASLLERATSPAVRFRDQWSLVEGSLDLLPQLAAVHRFMPGMRLRRVGDVRHCQGTVLADWVAEGSGGEERGKGTNVFTLGPDGRIEDVVGLWNRAAPASA